MKILRKSLFLCLLLIFVVSCSVKKQPSNQHDSFNLSPSDSTNLTCVTVASGSSKAEAIILALTNFAEKLEAKMQKKTETDTTLDKFASVHKTVLYRSFNNVTIKTSTKSFVEEGSGVNFKYIESVYKLTYYDDNKSMIIVFSTTETTDSLGSKSTSKMDISSRNASVQDIIQNLEVFGINTKIKVNTSGFCLMLSSKNDINDLISGFSTDSDSLNNAHETIERELAKYLKRNDRSAKDFEHFKTTKAFNDLEKEIEQFEKHKNK